MTTSQSISWTDVAREATEHLGRLLAIGTGCPPGYELPAARYLLGLFESEGIPALILPPPSTGRVSPSPRPNLVAHLPGGGGDEPLLLLSHLDSAPRTACEWEPDTIPDGSIFRGPGAITGVHLAVAQAMALILLARSEVPLRRTVRYAATSEGMGGRGIGLATLAKDHLEHITSDIAIGWGGLSWHGRDREPYSLLATADKGALLLRLRSEGSGGYWCIRSGKDPVERLLKALDRLVRIEFPPRPCPASLSLIRSIGGFLPDAKSAILNEILDSVTAQHALSELESDRSVDPGLVSLIRASLQTRGSVARIEANAGEGLMPRIAEADLIYCFPPGEDVEALARRVLEALGPDGVYLAEKEILPPSESALNQEVCSMARAAIAEVDPRANLIVGLAPWPTGLGSFRRFGTSVFGWEPFASTGSLADTLSVRGGPGERLDAAEFVREIRAIYSFLCRMAQ